MFEIITLVFVINIISPTKQQLLGDILFETKKRNIEENNSTLTNEGLVNSNLGPYTKHVDRL